VQVKFSKKVIHNALTGGRFCVIFISMKVRRKRKRRARARVNREGFMNSATREHRVKKGKGSFRRRKKHQKKFD